MLPLVLILVCVSVYARILNVTIDDILGDELTGQIPQYVPTSWISRSVSGAPCDQCTAQPDATYIYKGTWYALQSVQYHVNPGKRHDISTFAPDPIPATISISFNGTRIYVYFILFNNIGTVNHNTRLQFSLDGSPDPARDFLHLGDPLGEKYLYSQLVYDSRTLEHANHTLIVSNYSNGTDGSVALFDRAVYTTGTDDEPSAQVIPTPSPSAPASASQRWTARGGRSPRLGVVIGSAIAGAFFLIILAAGCWGCCRRRRCGGARYEPLTDAVVRSQLLGGPTVARGAERTTSAVSGLQPLPGDAAQLRSELGRIREELERVRRIAEPPEYTLVSLEEVEEAALSGTRPSSPTSDSPNTASPTAARSASSVVGAAAAGVVCLSAAALAFCQWRARRRTRANPARAEAAVPAEIRDRASDVSSSRAAKVSRLGIKGGEVPASEIPPIYAP